MWFGVNSNDDLVFYDLSYADNQGSWNCGKML